MLEYTRRCLRRRPYHTRRRHRLLYQCVHTRALIFVPSPRRCTPPDRSQERVSSRDLDRDLVCAVSFQDGGPRRVLPTNFVATVCGAHAPVHRAVVALSCIARFSGSADIDAPVAAVIPQDDGVVVASLCVSRILVSGADVTPPHGSPIVTTTASTVSYAPIHTLCGDVKTASSFDISFSLASLSTRQTMRPPPVAHCQHWRIRCSVRCDPSALCRQDNRVVVASLSVGILLVSATDVATPIVAPPSPPRRLKSHTCQYVRQAPKRPLRLPIV